MSIKSIKQILLLFKNEIKKLYSGSYLGFAWFFINPIIYTGIYYVLFEKVIQVKFKFSVSNVSFFEYLIIGLVLWNSFTTALLRSSSSIIDNAYILKKVAIPPEYYTIVYTLLYYIQGILFTSILFFIIGSFSVSFFLFYIIASINFFVFTLGLSLFFAALTVYIRDIPQLLSSLMNFLFYTVPIIYPYEMIPEAFKKYIFWNPILYIFKPFHDIIFYKEIDIKTLLIGGFISLVMITIGNFVFRVLKKGFYDVL